MLLASRRATAAASLFSAVAMLAVLTGCVGGGPVAGGTPSGGASTTTSAGPTGSPSATPTPTPTPVAHIPTDCRAMLSDAVLAQLGSTPLNDAAFAPTGVQPDGSIICVWRDPRADTTGIATTISKKSRGPALDLLNQLVAAQGFTCYTPNQGTRCEKTWQNPQYPVTDGRTLFWRDDVLIDTVFSNLAPDGYTDSIIAHVYG